MNLTSKISLLAVAASTIVVIAGTTPSFARTAAQDGNLIFAQRCAEAQNAGHWMDIVSFCDASVAVGTVERTQNVAETGNVGFKQRCAEAENAGRLMDVTAFCR
jgi:hypothetical protein